VAPRTFAVLAILLALLGLSLANLPAIRADVTFTVNSTDDAVDADIGDGACAAVGGACTLRAAVQEANDLVGRDVINIPAGTYKLTLEPPLSVAGGGPVDTDGVLDLDIADSLSISGQGQGVTMIDGDHISRVFDINSKAGSISVSISNLTIRNGKVEQSPIEQQPIGGGVRFHSHASDTNLTLVDVTIRDNEAVDGGGLMVDEETTTTITDSTIRNNHASDEGGGIDLEEDAVIHGNRLKILENTADSGGGFINTHFGTFDLSDSLIQENIATTYGGGVFTGDNGTTTITNTWIDENDAEQNGGGGIYAAGGVLVLNGVTISDNHTGGDGNGGAGVQQDSDGTIDIKNSTIANNTSDTIGGGIFIQDQGPTTVTNTTIVGNSPEGIYLRADGPITLTNTIIDHNDTDNCRHDPGVGDLESGGHNLSDDTTCSLHKPGDLVGDPMLEPLADNGGPTMTMALQSGSIAIDAGDDDICADTDQRGAPRIDGDGDLESHCDIGAYEFGVFGRVWGDLGCHGQVDGADALNGLLQLSGVLSAAAGGAGCPFLNDTLHLARPPDRKWGDLNCDGTADTQDIALVLRHVAGLADEPPADCPTIGSSVWVEIIFT